MRVHLETHDAELVTHKGCRRGEVAPEARFASALGGDGALEDAVAHKDGPSALLAEDGRTANGMRLDEALNGFAVDDVGDGGSLRHFSSHGF